MRNQRLFEFARRLFAHTKSSTTPGARFLSKSLSDLKSAGNRLKPKSELILEFVEICFDCRYESCLISRRPLVVPQPKPSSIHPSLTVKKVLMTFVFRDKVCFSVRFMFEKSGQTSIVIDGESMKTKSEREEKKKKTHNEKVRKTILETANSKSNRRRFSVREQMRLTEVEAKVN